MSESNAELISAFIENKNTWEAKMRRISYSPEMLFQTIKAFARSDNSIFNKVAAEYCTIPDFVYKYLITSDPYQPLLVKFIKDSKREVQLALSQNEAIIEHLGRYPFPSYFVLRAFKDKEALGRLLCQRSDANFSRSLLNVFLGSASNFVPKDRALFDFVTKPLEAILQYDVLEDLLLDRESINSLYYLMTPSRDNISIKALEKRFETVLGLMGRLNPDSQLKSKGYLREEILDGFRRWPEHTDKQVLADLVKFHEPL